MKTDLKPFPRLRLMLNLIFIHVVLGSCCAVHAEQPIVKVSVNPDEMFQTIEGFGACVTTHMNFPESYTDPAFFDLLVDDLGVSIMRVPMMEHTELGNDDADPNHFAWDRFNTQNNCLRKGIEPSMLLMQEFKKRGVERFLASPWSPPQFMKTNRSPIRGGFLRPDMYEEFAEYMAAYIMLAKKNWDIDLSWVSMQNESIFIEFYRSCLYHGESMREVVRAVMRKFEKEGIQSQILINEDMLFPERLFAGILPTMKDPETSRFPGHFATHRKAESEELKRWVELSKDFNRQSWMTETSGHQPTWSGAMKMGKDIHNYLSVGNFSAWIYWQIDGGDPAFSVLNHGEPSYKYYVSKHYYRYIRPGARRIEVDTDNPSVQVSAYRHDSDGTLTFVLINPTNEPRTVSIDASDWRFPKTYEWFLSTETLACESQGLLEKGMVELLLPAQSIATVYGHSKRLEIAEPLQAPVAWVVPESVGEETWGNRNELPFFREWQPSPNGTITFRDHLKKIRKKDLLDTTRADGWYCIHEAVLAGCLESVEYLLSKGVDVNASADDGWTPLHVAASGFIDLESPDVSKTDMVNRLLEAKADVHATTTDGWTPLHSAASNAYTGWRQNPQDPLDILSILIEAGAEVDARDIEGRTALHWAAWQGYPVFAPIPDFPDEQGLVVYGDVVRKLIHLGADVDAVDSLGRAPLHYACEMGYPTIVYELLNAGASHNIRDRSGESAWDIVLRRNDQDLIKVFESGALPESFQKVMSVGDVSEKRLGRELLRAAWDGNLELVKSLLSKGADTEYVDTDGFQAIDRARDSGHKEIVILLEAAK